MPIPTVWSEREPGGWHDCWVSAALMVLVYAGYTRFPLGLYSDAEREALERSQSVFPPERGGNNAATAQACANRYGVRFHLLLDHSADSLADALGHVGWGMSLAGLNSRFPPSAKVWDAPYKGAHQVAVIPQGKGMVLWLDPEATYGYAGDRVPITEVLRWALMPYDPLILSEGELAARDWAGIVNAFGTRFPSYVHSDAQALAWYARKVAELRRAGRI